MVCTGCCATLDHIVTYLFKQVTNKGNFHDTYQYRVALKIIWLWNLRRRLADLEFKSCSGLV